MRQLILLTFALLGYCATPMQGYQGPQDTLLTVTVVDTQGVIMQNVDVFLMKDNTFLALLKTAADGRASVRVGRGLFTLSIHQTDYAPIAQVVDTRSIVEPVLDIKIVSVPRVQETVSVQASTQDITEQTSSPAESIKPEEANESPLRPLTLTDALPLVPGVVVALNGQIQIEGSGEMHSALIVDSVDAGDPATGRLGLSAPIDVVDSIHVLTSPYLAQYGRFTAGVVTAETKPGGNRWHYDLNDPLPEFRIRSGHVRGLKSATPRFSFGGPIIPDRISYSEGLEFVDNKVPVRTLPFPFNETKTTSLNSFTQTDVTLTPRQGLTATLHVAPQNVRYSDLDFFNPQPVTPNDDTRIYTGAITHRIALGEALLQSTFSVSEFTTAVTPQGDLGMTVAPGGDGGNYFSEQQRHSRRLEWNELWSLKPINRYGIHKIQLGSSFASVADEGQLNAKTITMFDNLGVKIRTIDFSLGSPYDRTDQQPAVFVQDHWSINSHFAIDAGLRWEAQTITATTRFAPRTGFVWNPSKDGRTTVSGGIGIFYDSVPLNVYAFSHYPEQIITNYLPNETVSGSPQTYLNLTAEAAASGTPLVDQDHKLGNFAPYTVAWNLQMQQQFSEHLTVRAKYLENHASGLVTISPQVVQGQSAYVLAGDGGSRYRQFELTTQVSFQGDNKFYASYVRSLSEGTLNESDTYLGDLSLPFIRANLYTNRTGDIPNRFLTWGSVALPWKIKIYPKIELRSGFPFQSVDVYQNYIQNMKTASLRFPTYFAADARVAKNIKLNSKYTLRPSISIANITNHFNALQIHSNTADPQYGQFFGSYDRHGRFDLDVVF
ncbi:hypothetical protein HDF16_005599 [Granulicella aggregans]|uniref:TonB-dependent transporter Oar-like beta-barrel domain-containing protein n=2 Tax=Granulicella aggregans TaxID=474949 RepID=A0A7W7ZJ60_9BACT|nr:hypothetical protein [Granulicella aggregans]